MPLEDSLLALEGGEQPIVYTRLGQAQWFEAELSHWCAIDPGIECPRQYLRAQADPQHRQLGLDRRPHQPPFRHQIWVSGDLVRVHLAAEYDQPADLLQIRPGRTRIEGVQPQDRHTGLLEHRLCDAERVIPIISNAKHRLHWCRCIIRRLSVSWKEA